MQGSQTLGKPKKKAGSQRHSAGNIDYDNISGSQETEDAPSSSSMHGQEIPQLQIHSIPFRGRSKTSGDVSGK